MSSFKPIRALMGENEAIAPMMARLSVLSRLQKIYSGAVPAGLASASRLASVEGTTLVIATANGATAAGLKQMLPRLLLKFQQNQMQEQQVTGIRVVVQPDWTLDKASPPPRPPSTPRAPMRDEQLEGLVAELGDSPLKTTLERIRKRRSRAVAKGPPAS